MSESEGWEVVSEPAHRCQLPDRNEYKWGTIIRCNGCGEEWKRTISHTGWTLTSKVGQ